MSAINPLSLNAPERGSHGLLHVGICFFRFHAKSQHLANQRKYFRVFVQDDWKVTRKLTLNIGMN